MKQQKSSANPVTVMAEPLNFYAGHNACEMQPFRVLTTVVSNQNNGLETDANLTTEQNIIQTLE